MQVAQAQKMIYTEGKRKFCDCEIALKLRIAQL